MDGSENVPVVSSARSVRTEVYIAVPVIRAVSDGKVKLLRFCDLQSLPGICGKSGGLRVPLRHLTNCLREPHDDVTDPFAKVLDVPNNKAVLRSQTAPPSDGLEGLAAAGSFEGCDMC